MLWLKAYPQASAELPGQWTLTTFPLYAVRTSLHQHWHIYYYYLPLLLILFSLSISGTTIRCIMLACSAQASHFNTCCALNNSPRILFKMSWTMQSRLFRWDHISCFWHHIWCFCYTVKLCFVFSYIWCWETSRNGSEIMFFLSIEMLSIYLPTVGIDPLPYQPPLFWERLSTRFLDAGCRDLLSFSRKSISEVEALMSDNKTWLSVCVSIHPKRCWMG